MLLESVTYLDEWKIEATMIIHSTKNTKFHMDTKVRAR